MTVIHLSLISHTNVGKTTLARTLLRKDVGEVIDAPHVTETASEHTLIETADGEVLRLWDTPGFGDSARLLQRLQHSGNALGWFLTQVWDRYTDRPFFSSQQALRNIRDAAHVVLYLVNAAEDPSSLGYLDAEMQIVGWLGKPVIVLLNQLGPPRTMAEETAEVERWRSYLQRHECVRETLAFDAFARCWVQEHVLLERVQAALPAAQQATFTRLAAAWRARNEDVFHRSVHVLANQIAAIASDGEQVPNQGLGESARAWLRRALTGDDRGNASLERATEVLAERADARIRAATDELIALHGLSGSAASTVQARLAGDFAVDKAASRGKAGVLGGAVSGALGGLAADLASGGLTLGGGALLGALLGAAGGASIAHGYNLLRGSETSTVRWDGTMLNRLVAAALLRYLAVAHFGRGRGDYVESEYPAHWRALVDAAVEEQEARWSTAWSIAGSGGLPATLNAALERSLDRSLRTVLEGLYGRG
ncbi:MAG TPA: GTPase domain-containing protein [Steroidobacteraceae bacterium]